MNMVSLHIFQSVFISFNNTLQFSVSCTDFVKFMPRYFILVDGMVSGTVSEFQLPIFYMLLIYRKNHMCECICMYVLGWPKSSFRFFGILLWENLNFLANPVYIYIFNGRDYIQQLIKLAVSASSIFFWQLHQNFLHNHIIFHSVPFMLMRFLQFGCWKHELFAPL